MITIEKQDRISNYLSDGTKYVLSYFTGDKSYHCHGNNPCQITGMNITIETFDTEEEMLNRITELGIQIPEPYVPSIDDED